MATGAILNAISAHSQRGSTRVDESPRSRRYLCGTTKLALVSPCRKAEALSGF